MADKDNANEKGFWSAILAVLDTPLRLIGLSVLIVQTTLMPAFYFVDEFHDPLGFLMLFVPLFILVFAAIFLSVWRPEALKGDSSLEQRADQFAQNLERAVDGELDNYLDDDQKSQVWENVAEYIIPTNEKNVSYRVFCSIAAAEFQKIAKTYGARSAPSGILQDLDE